MTDKEKIKQEIERLKSEYNKESDFRTVRGDTAREVLDKLLSFIDSLREEPASEDLDRLVISLEETIGTRPHSREVIKEHLQKAAEWGRNHFEDKSEMVSEETTIVNDWQYGKDQDHAVIPAIHKRIDGFNVGDKVKIIIIKTK